MLENGIKTFVVQCCILTVFSASQPTLVYEWEKVDLQWPNSSVRDEYLRDKKFIAENNAINGIKIYNDTIYITIPKLKEGVPFSLVTVVDDRSNSPLLRPYPNWESHLPGDCSRFGLVQSMEIDPHSGYMWILDTIFVPRPYINIPDPCPTKIVIWDLVNNVEVHRYSFPKEVTGPGMFYLNDIVLDFDKSIARWAYISDTLGKKLVVYDRFNDHSYAFAHESMMSVPQYFDITIGDVTNNYAPLGINGIAMSADLENVFYCPLAGIALYQIPTSVLRNNNSTDADFGMKVQHVGNKRIQSDGLYYSQKNNLFYSTLGLRSVYKWPMTTGCGTVKAGEQSELVKDDRIEWVDSFSFDNSGNLWFVSNNLNTHFSNDTTQGKSNFFVWKTFVNDKSYLHFNFDDSKTCSASGTCAFKYLVLLCLLSLVV